MTPGRLKIWNDLAGEWEYPPGGGSQPLAWHSKNIVAADLASLDSTSVEVIPAGGGRFYSAPTFMILHYRYGTTPYTVTGFPVLQFGYGSTFAEVTSGLTPAFYWYREAGVGDLDVVFAATEDIYMFGLAFDPNDYINNNWAASDIENAPVSCAFSSGSIAGGDGTLTVRLLSSLIDGAP